MKKTIILFLLLALVASFSCSKQEKPREQRAVKREMGKTSKIGYLIDPVSKNPVDVTTSPYTYVYKEIEYNFESKENMEAFIKNPQKYIDEIEEMKGK